jgi:hypothetical protein
VIQTSLHLRALLAVVVTLAAAGVVSADDRRSPGRDARWEAIHEITRVRIAGTQLPRAADENDPGLRAPRLDHADLPQPSVIVVGFTGGLERHDSAISGVVRLRQAVNGRLGDAPEVAMLTYNNFNWRQAGRDVIELVGFSRPGNDHAAADVAAGALPQPVIVAYGHSWGGGSIAKFARLLASENLDISLAMYIDAFTVRNPRLPANIRYAVNFYQRTGVLRGLPLRGKRQLVPEAPEATTVLGSFRITPETEHFGWHWNLVQPLFYRHHHRISHDVRLQRYLFEIVVLHLELLAEAPAASSAAGSPPDVPGPPGA